MSEKKIATSIRLSPEGKNMLEILAAHYGITQAGVIEMALRKLMTFEGFRLEEKRLEGHDDKNSAD